MAPTTPLPPGWRPKARPELVFRRVGDEWVVFDPDGQRLHVLNLAAALVWSHCTGELGAEQIAEALGDAFEDEEAARAVPAALQELREAGLLEA